MIDLRSDTVTKPSPAMLSAMMNAKVGDDVYGEDETVNELQQMAADMFGMEAGLFCPSGTMTNQIAIKTHTQPGDELICAENSHVYKYEGGGIAFNSGVQAKLLKGNYGRITASQIEEAINGNDVHFPSTRLVCLENTSNRGGGSIYDLEEIKKINSLCAEKKLSLHLDGARIFNAIVESNHTAKEIGKYFESISVCLSKGLGAPVGSVLLGKKDFIAKAKRVRKVFGGGMRQAGYLAAAGIYALQNNIERLKEDHQKAKQVAEILKQKPFVKEMMPVETNIVIFKMHNNQTAQNFSDKMKAQNILISKISNDECRMVFHLDVTEEMVNILSEKILRFK
ncbi:MAG: low-specificity L-threonine aldolase [Bacteroidia bacterium]